MFTNLIFDQIKEVTYYKVLKMLFTNYLQITVVHRYVYILKI